MLFGTMLNLMSICETLHMKSNKQETQALKHNELFPVENVLDILPGDFCT